MIKNKIIIKGSSGFTLLELLVSITILSLIITISYSALRIGAKSWDASITNINNNSDKRSAIELIKNKLEHAYPIYWKNNTNKILAFAGNEERLQFIAPSPQGRELYEYFEYLLVFDKGATETSLELFFEPHKPDSNEFSVTKDSPSRSIIKGLSNTGFSYYGKPEVNGEEDWYTEWTDEFISLPSVVRVVMAGGENADINLDIAINLRSKLFEM